MPEDSKLISRAKMGEMEAFGELYERYLDLIYRYIRCRVSDEREAEDLTEVVFLKTFETIDRYQERGWPFSSFLYQVSRNLLADHYRNQRHVVSLEEAHDVEAFDSDLDEGIVIDERIQIVKNALEKLSKDYQEVLRLRLFLDMSTAEVAACLNRSEGACRVLFHRAMKALHKQVTKT